MSEKINDDIWESIRLPMVRWLRLGLEHYRESGVKPIDNIDYSKILLTDRHFKFGDYGTHYMYGWYVVNEDGMPVFAGENRGEFNRIKKIIQSKNNFL